ncbi:threonylcarbamoyl-AMP synthase [Dehalococcoides mccartyi]|nr:threonylcarbamoyl-AMP synthase [Dehalococcoides mccartyi]
MLISPDNSGLQKAAQAIKNGELVAFPTDTFFAIGADGLNSSAIEAVFATKGRNPGMPVPLLVSDLEMAKSLSRNIPEPLLALAEKFWPGALTLVLPASSSVPAVVSADTTTVGVRIPNNDVARSLIDLVGGPITGTSCNRTGREPIKDAGIVEQVFGSELALCIDAPCGDSTKPSTVISFNNGKIIVLRAGAISTDSLRNIVGDIVSN